MRDPDAAGATVQIFMFSVLACKVKQNAPRCHTFLEIVYARYGPGTHVIFICFALATNILVASQLLLGGSAVVTSLTGMNVYAAVWLIPTGVSIYVVLGGLRATFLCKFRYQKNKTWTRRPRRRKKQRRKKGRKTDMSIGDYSHTIIVMIIILYFMFDVYSTNEMVGSPKAMYDLLAQASQERPVEGNEGGSYLTLKSNYGLIFGVIQLCSGMGTVFLDQGYWQRAIASRPSTAVKAYIMGGFAWFAIPFGFATTLGLAAVALTNHPEYPTYPDPMTEVQVSSGLAAPFAAQTLLGKNGAIALLLTLFMAVTSSSSSELIAVSSILTFDVYKTYIKPSATPEQLIWVAHVMICVFGVVMAGFASLWNAVGINLGWLFLVMGLIIGGAVFPAAFTITWKGQTRLGAISGCLTGLAAGLVAWLVEAKVYYGELSVTTTGASYPTLAGNMAGVLTGLLVSVTVSLVKPDDFDWEVTRAINAPSIIVAESSRPVSVEANPAEKRRDGNAEKPTNVDDKATPMTGSPPATESSTDEGELPTIQYEDKEMLEDEQFLESPKALRRAYVLALILSIVLSFIMDFLIPIPMFLSHYVFSEHFFYAWVVISFIWVFGALGICGILPIWETRQFWKLLFGEIF